MCHEDSEHCSHYTGTPRSTAPATQGLPAALLPLHRDSPQHCSRYTGTPRSTAPATQGGPAALILLHRDSPQHCSRYTGTPRNTAPATQGLPAALLPLHRDAPQHCSRYTERSHSTAPATHGLPAALLPLHREVLQHCSRYTVTPGSTAPATQGLPAALLPLHRDSPQQCSRYTGTHHSTAPATQGEDTTPREPSLSVFTPPKEKDTAVCVATGFFPKNMNISMRVGDGDPKITVSNDKAVLSLTDKTYNFAAFLTVDKGKDQEVTCEANGETETSIKKEESANNTESIHLNFKSLTLQGLRVMFVKTVAFNFLMTVRALMF
ncbi:hypothetical protein EOD39_15954 [Acipenser ruthenus]|uniref:Immunoglobulin C1-set domain-containing protein n=1 Tax=Acipenser ruthenus TaxID=7906 RepID=A0A444UBK6_ACIRT|nr:hypothetical protein EOD39_15954 [Acipenser ruthenus]